MIQNSDLFIYTGGENDVWLKIYCPRWVMKDPVQFGFWIL